MAMKCHVHLVKVTEGRWCDSGVHRAVVARGGWNEFRSCKEQGGHQVAPLALCLRVHTEEN